MDGIHIRVFTRWTRSSQPLWVCNGPALTVAYIALVSSSSPQSLPYASQSTCVRLSLNLVECLYAIFKKQESDAATKSHAQVRRSAGS